MLNVIRIEPTIHDCHDMWLEKIEPTLEALQDRVGGLIEVLGLGICSAYINENGIAEGLPLNMAGTFVVRKLLANIGRTLNGVILGPIVFIGNPDEDGYDISLSPRAQKTIVELLGAEAW